MNDLKIMKKKFQKRQMEESLSIKVRIFLFLFKENKIIKSRTKNNSKTLSN